LSYELSGIGKVNSCILNEKFDIMYSNFPKKAFSLSLQMYAESVKICSVYTGHPTLSIQREGKGNK
jgi:hypothetical protein